jgi:uncharacterized membrane protein
VPSRRLLAWTLVAFVILAALAAVRAVDWSYGADTGTFVQIVLDAFGGMRDGIERGTHYRFHWSPSLALLWPFLAATHSLWVLQAILALATVACAPLVAALARARGLSASLADRLGAVVLVYPPLVAVGFGEFRDLGLLSPLALGWWLALERRAWWWFGALTVVLAGLREDVCLELALLGCAAGIVALTRKRRDVALAAFAAAALGIVSDLVYLLVVLPRVGPWPPSHFYDYPFAHGPAALLLAPFTHPLAFIAAIVTLGRLTYVLEALVPLALLPLRARQIVLALPGFAIVLLANSGLVWRMGMHYAALWIPWLLIAFIAGVATLRIPARWTTVAFVLSALVLVFFSPLHPAHYLRPSYHALGDARATLACVPSDATLATHDEWYAATAARRPRVTVLGEDPQTLDVQYFVVAADYPNQDFHDVVLPKVKALVRAGTIRPLCTHGDVTAYVRVRPQENKHTP